MSNFFKNLIERHTQPSGFIKPRLPGVFEPDRTSSAIGDETDKNRFTTEETEGQAENSNSFGIIGKKFENEREEHSFKKNTISSFETKKQGVNKSDEFAEVKKENAKASNNIRISSEKVSADLGKPISLNKAIKNEGNEPADREQNTGLNQIQMKHEIKNVTIEPQFSPKTKLTGRDKSMKAVNTEKQSVSSDKKYSTVKNESPGNPGIKLSERFNRWMNEPVKQSQPKEKEISMSPTIKVNIGRIEVRAIMEQGNTTLPRKPAFKPKLTLDDYLNQRNGGKR